MMIPNQWIPLVYWLWSLYLNSHLKEPELDEEMQIPESWTENLQGNPEVSFYTIK